MVAECVRDYAEAGGQIGWILILGSIDKAVFEKGPDGLEGIPDADLLTLRIFPRIE